MQNTSVIVNDDFNQALNQRLSALSSAQQRVIIEIYTFKPDKVGLLILGKIVEAKKRSPQLEVKILLDYWGSEFFYPEFALELNKMGIEIKYFNYPPFYKFYKLNFRTHRKIFIADQKLFIGGFNISEEYFGHHEELNMLDREVVLGNIFPDQAYEHFLMLWNSPLSTIPKDIVANRISLIPWSWNLKNSSNFRTKKSKIHFENLKNTISNKLTTNSSKFKTIEFKVATKDIKIVFDSIESKLKKTTSDNFIKLLDKTKKSIYFESLYFLPTPLLFNKIKQKLLEGTKIKLFTNSLVSFDSESGEILSLSAKYLRQVRNLGLKVFGANGKCWRKNSKALLSLHSKIYIFDDSVFIGSFNLDPRSFNTNLESSVIIENHQALAKHFRTSINRRIQKHSSPMNHWGQLVKKNGLTGEWTLCKNIKYYWVNIVRRWTEKYY